MSHQFESGFFASNRPAWHGLGKILNNPPTIAEAIQAAGLDWSVIEKPIFFNQDNQEEEGAEPILIESHKSLIRSTDNQVLGVVSKNYQPLQNLDAFNFFDFLLHDHDVSLEAAGSLREGKRIWVLAKINHLTQEVTQNDAVNPYLLLSNSHDASLAVWIQFTPIRVCCDNTLSYALSNRHEKREIGRAFSIRHQGDIEGKLAQAKNALNFAKQEFSTTVEQYKLMANHQISQFDLDFYLSEVLETDNPQSTRAYPQIVANFEKGRGNKGSTVWDAYNGITEWLDHQRGKNQNTRLNSSWFGASAKTRTLAHHKALELV